MNWKKIVSNLAPTLATALGGPLAGTATKFLARELLGDADAKESDIDLALSNATPEQLYKLKDIDNDFAKEMAKLGVDVFALEVKDRHSARDLAKLNMTPQIVLSAIFILGYFAIIGLLFSGTVVIDDSIRDMSNILLGVLTVNIPIIIAFWFGSSYGSKLKNKS
tara:strand:+ start:630 stop:1124 length:495 start_codon:yes stop_codon:yes gene_type:complete